MSDDKAKEAAVDLLRHLQIVGTDEELHAAWRDAGGHALTLSLLGRFIADAYEDRDIRHYREVKFEAADQVYQGRSAFKVMIAYEKWLQSGGPERQRELAVLRYLPTQMSLREIAAELFVSLNTVKTHSGAIYRKLGVSDRKSAVQSARSLRLL